MGSKLVEMAEILSGPKYFRLTGNERTVLQHMALKAQDNKSHFNASSENTDAQRFYQSKDNACRDLGGMNERSYSQAKQGLKERGLIYVVRNAHKGQTEEVRLRIAEAHDAVTAPRTKTETGSSEETREDVRTSVLSFMVRYGSPPYGNRAGRSYEKDV